MSLLITKPQEYTFPCNRDERGIFLKGFSSELPGMETYQVRQTNVVTTNHSGTLRGLHFQSGEYAESKLFRVLRGAFQLVCVRIVGDGMPEKYSFIISDKTTGVLVPRGYATGYLTLKDDTEVLYFSDNDYLASSEAGIRWNDPAIGVKWETAIKVVSEKDGNWPLL